MFNETEFDERVYLSKIKEKLYLWIDSLSKEIQRCNEQIDESQKYYVKSIHEIDNAEKASIQMSINALLASQEHALERKNKAERLVQSPYFGRVDFKRNNSSECENIYIGINNFDSDNKQLIFDWRAPISSLFYDFEKGEASFIAPSGEINGIISLKRQYRIRNGELEYMFDSSLKINDDILQEVLSRASSQKMKNIIATIQREQNTIIRDESHRIMVIQGVAGSGKTSIALHRVAYLLYRFKDELTSNNILILSPNKVFGNYISNVLPELGEENINEIEMEELAAELLGCSARFQTFYQQVDAVSHAENNSYIDAIRFKSSLDFARKLEKYLKDFDNSNFIAEDITIRNGATVMASRIEHYYRYTRGNPIAVRIDRIADDVIDDLECQIDSDLGKKQKALIHQMIQGMFRKTNPFDVYICFLKTIGCEDLIPESPKNLEYADVFPYIYIKSFFEKMKLPYEVKHLIIDEMQDYSPIQYLVLDRLFKCKMTILGDAAQAVNPYSSTNIETICAVLPSSFSIELLKSYRSTFEIMSFAQKIIPNPKLILMERHGEVPSVFQCENNEEMFEKIKRIIESFIKDDFLSMGIICKNQDEANFFHKRLVESGIIVRLISSDSKDFSDGVMIVSAHMAKGLEFDHVIIPAVDSKNYSEEIDKYMLYVACTRAMHKLDVLYVGSPSKFLK